MAGEIILYVTDDGEAQISLREIDGTVWLTQAQIADLFQVTPQAITQHIRAIYEDGELRREATCNDYLQVRTEGARSVSRQVAHYSLPMILAIGFRVRSPRGAQFRRWASVTLSEYLVKGFVMNDERLKDPEADYFEELLARIRDIRASEKLFYRKVLDIYATAADYDPNAEASQRFFQTVQNKMHHAAHGQTAAETKYMRADGTKPFMGMTSWAGQSKGAPPRRDDAQIAKNYLDDEEMDTLNRLTVTFLEFAESMAKNRTPMHMTDWIAKLDGLLQLGGHEVLSGAGKVSAKQAKLKVDAEYDRWHTRAINTPSPVETHFAAAISKAKAIEGVVKKTTGKGKRDV
jgi:hypothetical protein